MFLPGADRYYTAAQERQRRMRGQTWQERLIERADDVSIFDVLEDFFGLSLPRTGDSFKSKCPFYYEHADGGLDKGWRTYPGSNSSMCFVMHGYMGSVRLIQNKYSISALPAAKRILGNYGLLKPKHYTERYNDVLMEMEHRQQNTVGNPQHAVSALNIALRNLPSYTSRQFDSDVMEAMAVVLERLNEVASKGDPNLVREWFAGAKKIMTHVVERTH